MTDLYKVKTPKGFRYVEAESKRAAINWCVSGDQYDAERVSATDAIKLHKEGAKFEVAAEAVKSADKKAA